MNLERTYEHTANNNARGHMKEDRVMPYTRSRVSIHEMAFSSANLVYSTPREMGESGTSFLEAI